MNIEYPLTVESAFYGTSPNDVIQEKMRVYITMSWGDTIIVDDDMSINRLVRMLREQQYSILWGVYNERKQGFGISIN